MANIGATAVVSIALWVTTAVVAYASVLAWKYNRQATAPVARALRAKMRRDALSRLTDRAELEELTEAWIFISGSELPRTRLPSEVEMVRQLESMPPDRRRQLLKVEDKSTSRLNEFCAYIDDGLVRPRDLFREDPQLHLILLRECSLTAPGIWYRSLIDGRGRRGFRVLQLQRVLRRLRPLSPLLEVRQAIEVEVGGRQIVVEPATKSVFRPLAILLAKIHSPTITTRGKLRQNARAKSLARELEKCGLQPVDLGQQSESPISW